MRESAKKKYAQNLYLLRHHFCVFYNLRCGERKIISDASGMREAARELKSSKRLLVNFP